MEIRFNRNKKVTIREFWKSYLQMYNLEDDKLTKMEINVLSYVFSNIYVSWFRAEYSKEICDALNISRGRISAIKKNLIAKGYLYEKARGNILLTDRWKNIAKAIYDKIKSNNKVKLKFDFEEILL